MPLYRKLPVVIEAREFTSESFDDVMEWSRGVACKVCFDRERYHFLIPTLEGYLAATAGDFIVKGVQGEFYPCKPDIFAETYEPA